MKTNVDYSKLVPVDAMQGDDGEDTELLQRLAREARSYLQSFPWCGEIRKHYFGLGVGGIVGVFLFEIEPKSKSADDTVWVIVGDLPPAYLVTDNAPNPACALDAYIGEMTRWVNAAKAGQPVEGLIPVNAPSTAANAIDLESRLATIDQDILSYYKDDLK